MAFNINNLFKRSIPETKTLSNAGTPAKGGKGFVKEIAAKSIAQTRKDIKNWQDALNMAQNYENEPKRYPLYNLYREILVDLHLKSQINNRMLKSLSRPFVFKDANGEIDEDLTKELQNQKWVYQINKAIVETVFYGHSLVEFEYEVDKFTKEPKLKTNLIARQNIDPYNGLLYFDYSDDKKVPYREQREYGSWLIEFGDNDDFGLLNGCVPYVLFKRFGVSCWSELCEIYGIPPRVMKTNTQDKLMVNRAEKMMQDMGAAAWFIIDDQESFEFAKGVDTNGDVYKNLKDTCNNEMSMGISGVVIGQDTKNGSNSKEKTSFEILQDLVDSDLTLIEQYWNSTVIPALQQLGVITTEVTYAYEATEDIEALWKMVVEAAGLWEVDPEWVKDKFGIEITGPKKQPQANNLSLNLGEGFFV